MGVSCKFKGPYYPVGDIDWVCVTHGADLGRVDPNGPWSKSNLYCPRGENMSAVVKYRKKPVVIEVYLWEGKMTPELKDWLTCSYMLPRTKALSKITILTLEGAMETNIGDYIIKGVQGEFYPCKPDIFEQTYEKE